MFNMNNLDVYNRPIQQVGEEERQRLIDRIPREIRYMREHNEEILNMINQIEQIRNRNNVVIQETDAMNKYIEEMKTLNLNFAYYVFTPEVVQASFDGEEAQELNDRLLAIDTSLNSLYDHLNDMELGVSNPSNKKNNFSRHYEKLELNTLLLESRLEALKLNLRVAGSKYGIVNNEEESKPVIENLELNIDDVQEQML